VLKAENHKVASSPVDNLKVLRNVSSKMTLKQIKSCIGNLEGFKIQNNDNGIVSPYWGFFALVARRLPDKYLDKIREVVGLKHFGDISKPTSVIIKFDPKTRSRHSLVFQVLLIYASLHHPLSSRSVHLLAIALRNLSNINS
jgi:hypothetical protein